jgi:hypothetical protein
MFEAMVTSNPWRWNTDRNRNIGFFLPFDMVHDPRDFITYVTLHHVSCKLTNIKTNGQLCYKLWNVGIVFNLQQLTEREDIFKNKLP